jgi:hypothetical protein
MRTFPRTGNPVTLAATPSGLQLYVYQQATYIELYYSTLRYKVIAYCLMTGDLVFWTMMSSVLLTQLYPHALCRHVYWDGSSSFLDALLHALYEALSGAGVDLDLLEQECLRIAGEWTTLEFCLICDTFGGR